ncbi:MAG: FHA domain-containing protein [Acidimicrobiia bacterium]
MPEGLLGILKLCLIALIYLFFLRIVWAVAAELRAPVPSSANRGANDAAPEAAPAKKNRRDRTSGKAGPSTGRYTLVVTAPPELLGRRFDLDGELTVGRAAGCRIALDDSFVSTMHARLFLRDDQPWLEDLGSTNGTYVNDERVAQTVVLNKGDIVRFGQTTMSVVAS